MDGKPFLQALCYVALGMVSIALVITFLSLALI